MKNAYIKIMTGLLVILSMACNQSIINTIIPPDTASIVPENLIVQDKTTGSISLGWKHVSNAGLYKIYRNNMPDGTYDLVGTAVINTFIDTSLPMNTIYYYKVSSTNKNTQVESAQSQYLKASTAIPGPDKDIIFKFDYNIPDSVTVIWPSAQMDGAECAENYELFRYDPETGEQKNFVIAKQASPYYEDTKKEYHYLDQTVISGNIYQYKVRALTADTESKWTDIQTVNIQTDLPFVEVEVTPGKVTLAWQKITNAASYNIYRSESNSGPFTLIATKTNSANAVRFDYTDTNLPPGKRYYYKVTSFFTSKGEKDNTPQEVLTIPAPPRFVTAGYNPNNPPVYNNFVEILKYNNIKISWVIDTHTINNASGVQIFRYTKEEILKKLGNPVIIDDLTIFAKLRSIVFRDDITPVTFLFSASYSSQYDYNYQPYYDTANELLRNKTYYFYICTYAVGENNKVVEGADNSCTFKVVVPPAPPTHLSINSVKSTSAAIYWDAPSGTTSQLKYRYYLYKEQSSGNIVLDTSNDITDRWLSLSNLLPAKIHSLKIQTYNPLTNLLSEDVTSDLDPSNLTQLSFMTNTNAPYNFGYNKTMYGPTSVNLNWNWTPTLLQDNTLLQTRKYKLIKYTYNDTALNNLVQTTVIPFTPADLYNSYYTYKDTNLKIGRTYTYSILATVTRIFPTPTQEDPYHTTPIDLSSDEIYYPSISNPNKITISCPPPDITSIYQTNYESVTLNWEWDNTHLLGSGDSIQFEILRKADTTGSNDTSVGTTTEFTYTDDNSDDFDLNYNYIYNVKLKIINNGVVVGSATASTTCNLKLQPPGGFWGDSGTATGQTILHWNKVSGATGYKITRVGNPSIDIDVSNDSTTQYIDTNLDSKVVYYYYIKTIKNNFSSTSTNTIAVKAQ